MENITLQGRTGVILSGFKFGMLLQVAIGPVCVYIFGLATDGGFSRAVPGVFGVTLADALYVMLAILGTASILRSGKIQQSLRIVGALVVALFGVSMILGAIGYQLLPSIRLFSGASTGGAFGSAFLLTISNPLTILFWAGVFTTRLSDGSLRKLDSPLFGAGAVLATLLFLTMIAAVGAFTGNFLPDAAIKILNGAVGATLVCFAVVRLFQGRPKGEAND